MINMGNKNYFQLENLTVIIYIDINNYIRIILYYCRYI